MSLILKRLRGIFKIQVITDTYDATPAALQLQLYWTWKCH